MYSEPSSGIKLTAYSCICWLFHRIIKVIKQFWMSWEHVAKMEDMKNISNIILEIWVSVFILKICGAEWSIILRYDLVKWNDMIKCFVWYGMKLSECYFTNGNKISFFINGGNFLAGWVNITGKKKIVFKWNIPLWCRYTEVRVTAVNLRNFFKRCKFLLRHVSAHVWKAIIMLTRCQRKFVMYYNLNNSVVVHNSVGWVVQSI